MSLFLFLTVIQALVAAALVTVVLMQRSEGGGLGMGGSPAGLMSARSAADFLTRATTILATIFVALSILLAAIGVGATENRKIDSTLDRSIKPEANNAREKNLLGDAAAQPAQAPANGAPASTAPAGSDPLKGAAQ